MAYLEQVSIRNIRCFAGAQTVDLPRVTVLVGENSSGKTTFLGCCRAMAKLLDHEPASYDPFNSPFLCMGGFTDVATDGSAFFELGGRLGAVDLSLAFAPDSNGAPTEIRGHIHTHLAGTLNFKKMKKGRMWRLSGKGFGVDVEQAAVSYQQFSQWLGYTVRAGYVPYGEEDKRYVGNGRTEYVRVRNHLKTLSDTLQDLLVQAVAVPPDFAPPARSNNVPEFLRGLQAGARQVTPIRKKLRRLGQELGIFSDIRVHSNGTSDTLQVMLHGQWRNISDVGLGVHSILPTLSAIATSPSSIFLFQQPETHLHPSAHAKFAHAIARSGEQCILETHSDFVVDSLQICVRKGIIHPDEFAILWFDNSAKGTRVYRIRVNQMGELIDAPKRYREFFVKHTHEFLGLT